MRATEMHDLLNRCRDFLGKEPLFQPGVHEGFTHINYCRFCNYSMGYVERHGHSADCLHAVLERACQPGSASEHL